MGPQLAGPAATDMPLLETGTVLVLRYVASLALPQARCARRRWNARGNWQGRSIPLLSRKNAPAARIEEPAVRRVAANTDYPRPTARSQPRRWIGET